MKKITLIALASILSFCAFAQVASAQIKNLRDPQVAMDIAKKENKIVMYHFTGSSWCPPCKQLEAKVINDNKFKAFAKKNLAYVNMDKGRNGFVDKEFSNAYTQLMAKYGVRGFPTLVLINPENGKIETMVGYNGAPTSEIIKKIEAFKNAN